MRRYEGLVLKVSTGQSLAARGSPACRMGWRGAPLARFVNEGRS